MRTGRPPPRRCGGYRPRAGRCLGSIPRAAPALPGLTHPPSAAPTHTQGGLAADFSRGVQLLTPLPGSPQPTHTPRRRPRDSPRTLTISPVAPDSGSDSSAQAHCAASPTESDGQPPGRTIFLVGVTLCSPPPCTQLFLQKQPIFTRHQYCPLYKMANSVTVA